MTYSGAYSGANCRRGCGEMSQRYYKVPFQWLHSPERFPPSLPSPALASLSPSLSGLPNELIVFDEHRGTPQGIRLVNMAMAPRSMEEA